MVDIDNYVRKINTPFKWKGQVHDEIIFKFKDDNQVPIIKRILLDACDKYLVEGVHMDAAYKVDLTWIK